MQISRKRIEQILQEEISLLSELEEADFTDKSEYDDAVEIVKNQLGATDDNDAKEKLAGLDQGQLRALYAKARKQGKIPAEKQRPKKTVGQALLHAGASGVIPVKGIRRSTVGSYLKNIARYHEVEGIKNPLSRLNKNDDFVNVYANADAKKAEFTYGMLRSTVFYIKKHIQSEEGLSIDDADEKQVLCSCVHLMATMLMVMKSTDESEEDGPEVTQERLARRQQDVYQNYIDGYKEASKFVGITCEDMLSDEEPNTPAPGPQEPQEPKEKEARETKPAGLENLSSNDILAVLNQVGLRKGNVERLFNDAINKIKSQAGPLRRQFEERDLPNIRAVEKELINFLENGMSIKEGKIRQTLSPTALRVVKLIKESQDQKKMDGLNQMIKEFYPYARKQIGFNKPVSVNLKSDQANAEELLGKTAYYDPENYSITLFIVGRHPKDIMRSLSHELVHHGQNCRGDLQGSNIGVQGYAQKDEHLRDMEREAYEQGNMIFRDWEDSIKFGGNQMSMTEEKLREKIREAITGILGEKQEAIEEVEAEETEEVQESADTAEVTETEIEENADVKTEDDEIDPADRGALEEAEEQEEVVEEQEDEELDEWYQGTLYERLVRKWTK